MQTAVIYFSRSGQTKKVADAIAGELPGGVSATTIDEVALPDGDSLVFFGLPIEQYGPAAPAREYLQQRLAGRRVALFMTHAAQTGAPMVKDWVAQCREAGVGSDIVAVFDCQGELAAPVKQHMLNAGVPELEKWARMDNSQGQPDGQALERARAFAREVLAAQS